MNHLNPDYDSRVADWLEEDPDKAPAIVLQTVVSALPSIPQRRQWGPSLRELFQMPRFAIAAAIGLIAVMGLSGWVDRIGPGTAASPTPTVGPPASPRTLTGVDQALGLRAGTYRAGEPFSVPFRVTIPDGWRLGMNEMNGMYFVRPASDGFTNWVALVRPDKVFRDPCHTEGGAVAVGPSIDDLVTGLTSMPGLTAGPVTDVVVGGASGKTFTLDYSFDTKVEGCTDEELKLVSVKRFGLDEAFGIHPSGHDRIWVLDVNGQRLLISVFSSDKTTPAQQAEAEHIVDSIDFE